MGWSAIARFQRRASVAELREQGMTTGEANAQAVAQHRNEVLFDLYSRYIMCAALTAVVLSVLVCGLFAWHMRLSCRISMRQSELTFFRGLLGP